jgi:hypothetical protein
VGNLNKPKQLENNAIKPKIVINGSTK